MRVFFWFFLLVWLATVLGRFTASFMSLAYFSDIVRAHWGLRFFNHHLVVEALLVLVMFYYIHFRAHLWSSFQPVAMVATILGAAIIHYATLDLEIGYEETVVIAGQTHAVDWHYSPGTTAYNQNGPVLRIQVVLPDYAPIHEPFPINYLRLDLTKAQKPDTVYATIFSDPHNGPNDAQCVEEYSNRYCRFGQDGVWYLAHFQNSNPDKAHLFPTLEDLKEHVPRLFDTFITE